MKERLQAYRHIISKNNILLGSLLLFFISQVTILSVTADLGRDFLGLQTTLSSKVFLHIAQSWKTTGLINSYYQHFYLDFIIHPILYGVFISSLLAWTFDRKRISASADILLLLPFLASVLDITENSLHLYLLADFSRISAAIVYFSGFCSWTKWIIAFVCLFGSLILNLPFWRRAANEANHVS